jgi:hypothetical protein
MNVGPAHDFLDRVRDGLEPHASVAEITAALRDTGDFDPDAVIRAHRPVGTWESVMPSQVQPDPFGGLLTSCPKTLQRVQREMTK